MFICQIIVKIRIHHQTRNRTLYKLIYRGIFYPAFFLCACERSFETASFCLKFWLFSSRRPRKLILSIFSKSKRSFEKQTTPRLVTYLHMPIYGQDMSESDFFYFGREISILLDFYRHLPLRVSLNRSKVLGWRRCNACNSHRLRFSNSKKFLFYSTKETFHLWMIFP